MNAINLFWFRRDLRIEDNTALFYALQQSEPVLPVFIFDPHILQELPANDRRVSFIYHCLETLQNQIQQTSSSLVVLFETPEKAFESVLAKYPIKAVFTNHDYEPYATQRDEQIKTYLLSKGITFHTYKDQVIFEKSEVTKDDGKPYTVYTPYSKKWKSLCTPAHLESKPSETLLSRLLTIENPLPFPTLESMGFDITPFSIPPIHPPTSIIEAYHQQRDIPSIEGTSKLSIHLRFGTISIRQLVRRAYAENEKFLNELIWREFYMQILWHFPHVVAHSFKPAYDRIAWRNNEQEFQSWCQGKTGYPIVDAGMRQLNETGWMHNRVRMIVASFLTKHLLIDWRWGEAYFARHLNDFELSSNNGGWQWAAGSGVDAAPYFRVFNPHLQTLKFDPDLRYIRHWVPEFDSLQYVAPIVNHEMARKRCLEVYKAALDKNITS
jgi:deoxyribodipyrimidine photo-lyase